MIMDQYDKISNDAQCAAQLATARRDFETIRARVQSLRQALSAAEAVVVSQRQQLADKAEEIRQAEIRGKVAAYRDIGQRLEQVSDHITRADVEAFGLTQKVRANALAAGLPDPAIEYARLYTENRTIASAGHSG